MPGRIWTHADRRLLRDLASEGCGHAEAAQELGRTRRSVKDAARRQGVRFRKGPARDVDKRLLVLDLLGRGLSLSATARQLGVSVGWAWYVVRALIGAGLVRKTGRGPACRYKVVA